MNNAHPRRRTPVLLWVLGAVIVSGAAAAAYLTQPPPPTAYRATAVVAPPTVVQSSIAGLNQFVTDLTEKLTVYEQAGVQEYLVALVEPGEVRWHRLDGGSYRLLEPGADGVLRSEVFPGLWLDPAALFAEDEGRFQAVLREGIDSDEHGEFVELLRQRRAEG